VNKDVADWTVVVDFQVTDDARLTDCKGADTATEHHSSNVLVACANDVVEADTINTFKNRLDKYWSNQDVLFNFNSDWNW